MVEPEWDAELPSAVLSARYAAAIAASRPLAEIEIRHGDKVLLNQKRQFAIRRFGARDRFLAFEGKRFVLRGVWQPDDAWRDGSEWEFARDSWTAVVVPRPSDEACDFASRRGILLVADLTSGCRDSGLLASELHRLAQRI